MSEFNECSDSWTQTIVEASRMVLRMSCRVLQRSIPQENPPRETSVARQAKKEDVAGVNQDVGDLDEEQVGVNNNGSFEGHQEDNKDSLLKFERQLCPSMASVALSIDLIQHNRRFPIHGVDCILGPIE
jgi:hypothetical protein